MAADRSPQSLPPPSRVALCGMRTILETPETDRTCIICHLPRRPDCFDGYIVVASMWCPNLRAADPAQNEPVEVA